MRGPESGSCRPFHDGRGPVTRPLEGFVLALDVDGVLLDATGAGPGGWFAFVSERFGVDADLLQSTFFDRAWADVVIGRAPIERALTDAVTELGWTMTVEELLNCWFEVFGRRRFREIGCAFLALGLRRAQSRSPRPDGGVRRRQNRERRVSAPTRVDSRPLHA